MCSSTWIILSQFFLSLFARMAASYEIITFLSVPPSCRSFPNQQQPGAAQYADALHTSSHTLTHGHTASFSPVHCVCVLPMQPLGGGLQTVLSAQQQGRRPACVCVCVCEVMWHFWADMKRHSAPGCLEGAPGYRRWWRPGVSGGRPRDVNKRKRVKHKLQNPALLLRVGQTEDGVNTGKL